MTGYVKTSDYLPLLDILSNFRAMESDTHRQDMLQCVETPLFRYT